MIELTILLLASISFIFAIDRHAKKLPYKERMEFYRRIFNSIRK